MGTKFEVLIWVKGSDGNYGYQEYWCGESFLIAVWKLFMAKRSGCGCATLHWR